ncbi:MAG TPA: hypothetical protein VNR66_09750 [Solirubrobacteraceae bacterium]|nr:hypothetical protein [Solirubrobacteraceae bacterium]
MSAKWPRWLVPNCSSKPSAVRPSGGTITTATVQGIATLVRSGMIDDAQLGGLLDDAIAHFLRGSRAAV